MVEDCEEGLSTLAKVRYDGKDFDYHDFGSMCVVPEQACFRRSKVGIVIDADKLNFERQNIVDNLVVVNDCLFVPSHPPRITN